MNVIKDGRPVLFLGAHPDDEISCGGTLHRLIREGHEVHYAYMSECTESTVALGFDAQQLLDECSASCTNLGILEKNIYTYDFPVRRLPQYRQEILEELVSLRKLIKPGLVLVASRDDVHQDHSAVTHEAVRAFKHSSILGYEFPWNQLVSHVDLLSELESDDLEAKIRTWNCYATQASRGYHGAQVFNSLAQIRGMQANVPLAEGFEVIRVIV